VVRGAAYFGLSAVAGGCNWRGLRRALWWYCRFRRGFHRVAPASSPGIGLSSESALRGVPRSPGIGLSTWSKARGTDCASASETVSAIRGSATHEAPANPRSTSALRRDIAAGLSASLISNLLPSGPPLEAACTNEAARRKAGLTATPSRAPEPFFNSKGRLLSSKLRPLPKHGARKMLPQPGTGWRRPILSPPRAPPSPA
jgi:hypothetical protein